MMPSKPPPRNLCAEDEEKSVLILTYYWLIQIFKIHVMISNSCLSNETSSDRNISVVRRRTHVRKHTWNLARDTMSVKCSL